MTTVQCPHCGEGIQGDFKLCPHCGKAIQPPQPTVLQCPCGATILSNFKICPYCGTENKPKEKPAKKCPHCSSTVKGDGIFCPHCGKNMSAQSVPMETASSMSPHRSTNQSLRPIGGAMLACSVISFFSLFMPMVSLWGMDRNIWEVSGGWLGFLAFIFVVILVPDGIRLMLGRSIGMKKGSSQSNLIIMVLGLICGICMMIWLYSKLAEMGTVQSGFYMYALSFITGMVLSGVGTYCQLFKP